MNVPIVILRDLWPRIIIVDSFFVLGLMGLVFILNVDSTLESCTYVGCDHETARTLLIVLLIYTIEGIRASKGLSSST